MSTQAVAKTRPATPMDMMRSAINTDAFRVQLETALPKHLSADRMVRMALTAALGNPKIAEAASHDAGRLSIYKAMLTASQLGLELDGRQGHLVPFNDSKLGMLVQFIPGYQGLLGLAYNHPSVKAIWAEAVYEKDKFVYKLGLNRELIHEPFDGEDRGALFRVYAVAELAGAAKAFVCLSKAEVLKARKSSRGADSPYSPWNNWPEAMWKKTAIRQLCKFIPQSAELRTAMDVDDEDAIDVESTPVPQQQIAAPPMAALQQYVQPAPVPVEQAPAPESTTPSPQPKAAQPAAAPRKMGGATKKEAPAPQPPPPPPAPVQQEEVQPEPEPEPEPETQAAESTGVEETTADTQEPTGTPEGNAARQMIRDTVMPAGVSEEDFCDWMEASGKYQFPDGGTRDISSVPDGVAIALAGNSKALAACIKVFGTRR